MITAQPFERADLSGAQGFCEIRQWFGRRDFVPRAIENAKPRPTCRAAGRLRVKAPVGRVVVLGTASRAHREAGHRCARPIVGRTGDDRQARTAIGAIQKRVAKAAIGGIEQLGQAVSAGGNVRRNKDCPRFFGVTRLDEELAITTSGTGFPGEMLNAGKRRRLIGERTEEIIERGGIAFDFDQHVADAVLHETGELQPRGEGEDEGPKADALHHPAHGDDAPLHGSTLEFRFFCRMK